MTRRQPDSRPDQSLNIFVNWEIKRALLDLSGRYDRSLADVVRAALRLAIPLLRGVWETEKLMLDAPQELLRAANAEGETRYSKVVQGKGPCE